MSLSVNQGTIWMDGTFVNWQDAGIHPMANTIQYGLGIFEGIRVYLTESRPAIFRLEDHTARLIQSANMVMMKLAYTEEELIQAQIETVQRNIKGSGYIRPLAYYGAEFLGLHSEELVNHVMIAAWEMEAYHAVESPEHGIKICTSSYSRLNLNSSLCKAKICGNYVNSHIAYHDAKNNGFQDALLLDAQGNVAEASSSNVFIIRDDCIVTPPASSIFVGITRDTVQKIALDLGLKAVEANITRDEFYVADEAFLAGTLSEITAITQLDHRTIGTGKRGAITKKIEQAYVDIVTGKNDKYMGWLTIVK